MNSVNIVAGNVHANGMNFEINKPIDGYMYIIYYKYRQLGSISETKMLSDKLRKCILRNWSPNSSSK